MVPTSARFDWSPLSPARAGLAAALLALGLSGSAWAEVQRSGDRSAEAVSQLPAGHALAQRDKVLSAAARTAVNYVGAAAQAIAAGELAQAERLLAQARRLLDQIQTAIRERGGTGALTVIPVLAQVRVAGGGEVSADLAARLKALEPQVLAGEHDRVLAGLQGVGVGLSYQYVGMQVQGTGDGIDRAAAALAAGDTGGALKTLKGIVYGLEVREVSIGKEPGP